MFNYVQVNLKSIDVVSYRTLGSSPTPGSSTPAATPQEPSCSAPPTPRATTSEGVPSNPGVIHDWLDNLPSTTSQPFGHRKREGPREVKGRGV